MENDTFDRVVEYLQKYAFRSVDLVGGGEITRGPMWRERCERLLDLGFALSTTINMAKVLTAEEINTLSRFDVVNVSIDTVDPEVLRRVRVGTDLRNVVYNLMMLRAAQIQGGRPEPALGITAVYSAEIVRGIDGLVAFAIAAGVKSFGIQDLVEYGEPGHNVGSVWTLTGEDALDAAGRTKRALKMARDANIVVLVQPEFEERLETLERMATTGSDALRRIAGSQEATYMKAVPAGFTRECTDPWTFIHVLGDGTLRPCCFSSVALGRLDSGTTFEAIQNSDTARRLRLELLTGSLDHHCSICSLRPQIRVEAFRQKIFELAAPCHRQGPTAEQATTGGLTQNE
jgi:MoaA/NifB/PqqE/SkfB family radical SAM enzyme